jgi:transcription antitermination factor NusG
MSNEQDIKDIVGQLERLQIRQTALVQRLARLTAIGNNNTNTEQPNITQEFSVGDQVRITNPGLRQADRGTITNIDNSRITVQARNGTKITRAPKNLVLE